MDAVRTDPRDRLTFIEANALLLSHEHAYKDRPIPEGEWYTGDRSEPLDSCWFEEMARGALDRENPGHSDTLPEDSEWSLAKDEVLRHIEEISGVQTAREEQVAAEDAAMVRCGSVAVVNTDASTERLRSMLVVATQWYSKRHGCALPDGLAQTLAGYLLVRTITPLNNLGREFCLDMSQGYGRGISSGTIQIYGFYTDPDSPADEGGESESKIEGEGGAGKGGGWATSGFSSHWQPDPSNKESLGGLMTQYVRKNDNDVHHLELGTREVSSITQHWMGGSNTHTHTMKSDELKAARSVPELLSRWFDLSTPLEEGRAVLVRPDTLTANGDGRDGLDYDYDDDAAAEEPQARAHEYVDHHTGQPVYLCDAASDRLANGETLVLIKGAPLKIALPNHNVRLAGAAFDDMGGSRLRLSAIILVEREGPSRYCNYRNGHDGDVYVAHERGVNVHTRDDGGGTRLLVFDPSEIYEYRANQRWR